MYIELINICETYNRGISVFNKLYYVTLRVSNNGKNNEICFYHTFYFCKIKPKLMLLLTLLYAYEKKWDFPEFVNKINNKL